MSAQLHTPEVSLLSTDKFDFSGNYVFISSSILMHRLDESIRPLLEKRGGNITRIYTSNPQSLTPEDFSLATLPACFFHTQSIRAVFCTDNCVPPALIPSGIPLIAVPHAFWRTKESDITTLLKDYPSFLGSCDYYFSQGDVAPLHVTIASLRRHDKVFILPLGSLKIDSLRQCWTKEHNKTSILYCCGYHQRSISIEDKYKLIKLCLEAFPQYDFILRPFPGDRLLYNSLADAFRSTRRFRIDSSRSTLQKLPSAAAVLADNNSTVGHMFSLATGQPAVIIACRDQHGTHDGTLLNPVYTPEEAIAALSAVLALKDKEHPELVAMRNKLTFQPGHAQELFFSYLMQILSGTVPQEAVEVPCEYIGDLQLDSPTDEIIFFLRVLRSCRVEFYYTSMHWRFNNYTALQCFYRKLYEGHTLQNKPALVSIQKQQGRKRLLIAPQNTQPFFCPSPLSDYNATTKIFIQQNRECLCAKPTDHILLPDRNKTVFCHALASLIEEVYGLPVSTTLSEKSRSSSLQV